MYNDRYVTAIIAAAGKGVRMGTADGKTKQFMTVGGLPVIVRTLTAFEKCSAVDAVIVVSPEHETGLYSDVKQQYGISKLKSVVCGGSTRQQSVKNGVSVLPDETDYIVIHDGARCLVTPEMIVKVIEAASETGAAIAAARSVDTVKAADGDGNISETLDRDKIYLAQTPQVFLKSLYIKALENAPDGVTDDASICEASGTRVKLVDCGRQNIKLTVPEDIPVIEALLKNAEGENGRMRVGHGFDAHRLVEGRKLILGGVDVPFEKGLDGHSDADVLVHAICDALLGAASLGDIGKHFPPSDDAYKGICSLKLL